MKSVLNYYLWTNVCINLSLTIFAAQIKCAMRKNIVNVFESVPLLLETCFVNTINCDLRN